MKKKSENQNIFTWIVILQILVLLPVATSVERVFSAMNTMKTNLRTTMGDQLLNDCLVIYIEREIFKKVTDDNVIKIFMTVRRRRVT
jgi:type IV secretory pathway TrbL component